MSSAAEITRAPAWQQPLFEQLYRRSSAEAFGLEQGVFCRLLAEIGVKYLRADVSEAEACAFYSALHMEELALARACALGISRAWEIFVARYRERVSAAAHGIARHPDQANELAESLYADLFGVEVRNGQRNSKLALYTGLGSLAGWLRTVLAQQYVNRYRSARRLVSLEERVEAGLQLTAPEASIDPPDARVSAALELALVALVPEQRFILASYFLDERTLAEIARLLGIHESTVSRKLERALRQVRKSVTETLKRSGMDGREIREALAEEGLDVNLDMRRLLAQETRASQGARASQPSQEKPCSPFPVKGALQ